MAEFTVQGSASGSALQRILNSEDIDPGSVPGYQTCKDILLFHPLGLKMTQAPIKMAQSQKRIITIPDSPEDRVVRRFEEMWDQLGCDTSICNAATIARAYGIATLVLDTKDEKSDTPIDLKTIADKGISLKTFDPLNTSGSLVLNQNTDAMDFMKPGQVSVNGRTYHGSRTVVMMNEDPIYLAYTTSAFGFVGRSVYQRSLFPLKSYLQTMITDDLVTLKVGVIIAKIKQAGSIIDNVMQGVLGIKRALIKASQTGNVLGIGPEDSIESMNFQNLEAPASMARTNILKNIATAADMPAKLLENETMVGGMAEGTEDARNIDKYIRGIRKWLEPLYTFHTLLTMYKAWTPEFYKTLAADFPEYVSSMDFDQAFIEWKNSFTATWPSLIEEPASEKTKVDQTKLDAVDKILGRLLPVMDPHNKAELVKWAATNINDMQELFGEPLELDYQALEEYEPLRIGAEDGEEGEGGQDEKAFVDSVHRIAGYLERRKVAGAR